MDRYDKAIKVLTWAKGHPEDWEVICGYAPGGLERCTEIAGALQAAQLYELALMMTVRAINLELKIEEK